MEVGVREFKAQLSKYLRRVARGERITITSHGRPVAEVVAPAPDPEEEHWRRLIAEGVVTPATKPMTRNPPPPEKIPGGASRYILEEREADR